MFTEQERRIFGPFADGKGGQRYADPVAVYRNLVRLSSGNLNDLLKQYNEGDVAQASVAARLADLAIVAFELPLFDQTTGQGTLQDEALDLLRRFLEWRDQKKTPAATSPISAPPTAPAGSDHWTGGQMEAALAEYEQRKMRACPPCGQKAALRRAEQALPGETSTTRPITPSAST